jgi:hypothetical protein
MEMLTMEQQNNIIPLETNKSKILSDVLLNDMIKCVSSKLTTLGIKTITSFHIGALKSRFIDIQMSSEKYGANGLPHASAIGWRI